MVFKKCPQWSCQLKDKGVYGIQTVLMDGKVCQQEFGPWCGVLFLRDTLLLMSVDSLYKVISLESESVKWFSIPADEPPRFSVSGLDESVWCVCGFLCRNL